jgi:hypothetical protein
MPYRPILSSFLLFIAFIFLGLTACAPEFQTDENTYKFYLDQDIRNLSYGYYRRYYVVDDTARWKATVAGADTIVKVDNKLKIRNNRIWYEVWDSPTGFRAEQQYPGWVPRSDSVSFEDNLLVYSNRQYMKVDIPAADIVLNGDSIRFGIIRSTAPAYGWNFKEHQPQQDRLILTTYGNDPLPISLSMDAVGEINRQTTFRIGRHSYVLRYLTPEYDAVIIEELEDSRGLPYTAELDLSYKPVPVNNLDGTSTSIMRTPGKELLLYFWTGSDYEGRVQQLDSLYHALPPSGREQLEIVLIARYNLADRIQQWTTDNAIRLPVYQSTDKTCLRLNCPNYLPYFIRVNGRGRITSFYGRPGELKRRLEEMME